MTEEERRRLNKFGMGGDPNVLYGDDGDQGDTLLQPVVAPVGRAEVRQPVPTDVQTATPPPADYDAEMAGLADEHSKAMNDQITSLYDYATAIDERNRRAEEEMRQQERADRMAGTATGLTEMAANIANLLSVGQGHATPQQYRTFSQDWMNKADQTMRERRHRADNWNAQRDRLNFQLQQVKGANRLADIKMRMDLAQQKEAARVAAEKEEYNRGLQERKMEQADRKLDQEDKALAARERQIDAGIEAQKAQTAQGWARLNETKRQFNAELASKGLNAKGEPDEALMKKISDIRSRVSSGSGKDNNADYFFVDKNGDVNVARMEKTEYEDILTLARGSIAGDLGEAQAKEFNQEMSRAIDDKAKSAVLKKWMAKSPTCGAALRLADPTYRGKHGVDDQDEPVQQATQDTTSNKKLSVYQ